MKDLQSLQLFTRVARLGSFSAAAREQGMSQPQASRIVAELEQGLGARLLARTTRAVKATDAGSDFLARIEPLLAALEDAEASVREGDALRGVLRVGMPASFGVRVLLPRLAAFTEAHPALKVELMLADRFQDMVREAIDVGIRVGTRPDATGTSRPIGKMGRVVVAAPRYLERAGIPKAPAELAQHRIIAGPAAASNAAWRFERNGQTVRVALEPQLVIDNTLGAVIAAKSGLGITSTTAWSCEEEIADGSLVTLLGRWELAPAPAYAFFPAGRSTRKSARIFTDFLARAIHNKNA